MDHSGREWLLILLLCVDRGAWPRVGSRLRMSPGVGWGGHSGLGGAGGLQPQSPATAQPAGKPAMGSKGPVSEQTEVSRGRPGPRSGGRDWVLPPAVSHIPVVTIAPSPGPLGPGGETRGGRGRHCGLRWRRGPCCSSVRCALGGCVVGALATPVHTFLPGRPWHPGPSWSPARDQGWVARSTQWPQGLPVLLSLQGRRAWVLQGVRLLLLGDFGRLRIRLSSLPGAELGLPEQPPVSQDFVLQVQEQVLGFAASRGGRHTRVP